MDEQNGYDQLADETTVTEYIERDNETEIFFDTLIDATSIHFNGESNEQMLCCNERQTGGEIVSVDDELEQSLVNENEVRTQKSHAEKKPKRRRVTFLKRLERARVQARRAAE